MLYIYKFLCILGYCVLKNPMRTNNSGYGLWAQAKAPATHKYLQFMLLYCIVYAFICPPYNINRMVLNWQLTTANDKGTMLYAEKEIFTYSHSFQSYGFSHKRYASLRYFLHMCVWIWRLFKCDFLFSFYFFFVLNKSLIVCLHLNVKQN